MTYRKSPHSSLDGERYEIRLAALLFLRCKRRQHEGTISRFQLATNVKAGMQLDDIVLRYATVSEPQVWHTWFLQLKKKKNGKTLTDSALMGDGSDFGLRKYVKSARRIREGLLADEGREELLNGSWENCRFGLYTNAGAEGRLTGRRERGLLGEMGILLGATALGFEAERDAVVFRALEGDADGRDFLERVKVFPGQPTPDELVSLVKRELRSRGDVPEGILDLLYASYERRVEGWWAEAGQGRLLDGNADLYALALADASLHRVVHVLSPSEVASACHDLRFRDLKPLEEHFQESFTLLHVVAPQTSLGLSCTKLLQVMRERCPDSFAFFSLQLLRREMDSIVPVWRTDEKLCWLVVLSRSSDRDEEDHRELCDEIHRVLLENRNKRIAVVSGKCDSFTSDLTRKLCVADYKEIQDDCRVSQLGEETVGELMRASACFQGCRMDVGSLFEGDDSLDIALDDRVVSCLKGGRSLTVGWPLPDNVSYYVPRTLLTPAVPRGAADLGGVGGVMPGGLGGPIPAGQPSGVCLDPARRELCEGADTWMHLQDCQPAQRECKRSAYEADDCFDLPQRSVLVVGEPGMGKTTLAAHLAGRTKRARPAHWVVHANLAQHARLLETTAGDDPVEFLSQVVGVAESPFLTSLLRRATEVTGRATVILDGFDEICPENLSPGLRLVSGLLRTRVARLLVTSRRSTAEALKIVMSTAATRLREFTAEDQQSFLFRYWREEAGRNNITDDDLTELIGKLLARLSESLNDREKRFTGIPLQTMMLAEVFSNHVANPETQLPKRLDLIYLFEEFIEKKFKVYVRKLWPDTHASINGVVLEDMRACFNEKHMNASLVYLLPPDWLARLDSGDEIVRKSGEFLLQVLSGQDKTGIVDGVFDRRPKFLHRCFAEFYAARFFLGSYARNREFLREHMFEATLRVVRGMFDGMMAGALHYAALCDDVELTRGLLAGGRDVGERDRGGRTALHLAAGCDRGVYDASFDGVAHGMPPLEPPRHGPTPTLRLLLDAGADMGAVDSVLGWTPLQYAVGGGAWGAAEMLLDAGSDPGRFVFPPDEPRIWSAIIDGGLVRLMMCVVDAGRFADDSSDNYYVVERSIIRGHVALVKLLVTRSEDVLKPRVEGRTLIHQAARCGQRDILDYLLRVVEGEAGEVGRANAINLRDNSGVTAAYLALDNGFLDMAALLTERGGDPNALDAHLERLLLNASFKGRLDVLEYVAGRLGDDPTRLKSCLESTLGPNETVMVAMCGHVDVLRWIADRGCDVASAVDETGVSVLHAVIGRGSVEDVRWVVEGAGGRLVNAAYRGGVTALHCLAYVDNGAEIAGYLLSEGADVWATDENGRTPLHWAATRSRSLPLMRVLVGGLGGDTHQVTSYVNAKDSSGATARDFASDEVTAWLDRVSGANATPRS